MTDNPRVLRSLMQTRRPCNCHWQGSQWEGVLDDGTPVFIRYRWGWLRVELSPGTDETKIIYQKNVGDMISEEKMLDKLKGVLVGAVTEVK